MGPSPAGPPTCADERLRDSPPTPAPVSAAPPVAQTAACAPSQVSDPALLRLAGLVEDRVQNTSFAALPAPLFGALSTARSSLAPGAHGGNMDTPEMSAGVTCCLGVNVEGALFSLGDGHCRQGEGETCGVAVEAAMDTVVVIDLLKGVPCA